MARISAVIALTIVVAGCHSAIHPAQTTSLPRLRFRGSSILTPRNHPVTLVGVNLGNWLLVEPGAFDGAIGPFPDQVTLFNTFRTRFGPTEADHLIQLYRDNFITERDIALIHQFGFNFLRVGFDYSLFEDDANPMHLRPDAFVYTDRVLTWARKYHMYILFDLHGAQGRQVDGKQSGEIGRNEFWDSPTDQQRSLWLWQQIAQHYKNQSNIFGYEALNEPWGKTRETLRDYCSRWYPMMRAIDPDAVLVFPGWYDSISFYGPPAKSGWRNMLFDMHFYPGQFSSGQPGPEACEQFLTHVLPDKRSLLNSLHASMLIGELKLVFPQPGSADLTRQYLNYCAVQHWPVTLWTWKELRPLAQNPNGNWMLATNADNLPRLNLHSSPASDFESFFQSLSTMPLRLDDDLRESLAK
jgi:endoglucanase